MRLAAFDLRYRNLGDGAGELEHDRAPAPFRWQGSAHEILERLRRLEDGAGSEAVVRAFERA